MDLESLTEELAQADLSKGMPPKLRYKFMKWLRSMNPAETGVSQMDRRKMTTVVKEEISKAVKEAVLRQNLKKNEVMSSVYDTGDIKFDFGSEVPESVKKAAMNWAKKRGLKPVEASLQKSANSTQTVLFSNGSVHDVGNCVKRVKWVLQ